MSQSSLRGPVLTGPPYLLPFCIHRSSSDVQLDLFATISAEGNGNGYASGKTNSGGVVGKSGGGGTLLADRMLPPPRTHRAKTLPNEFRGTARRFIGVAGGGEIMEDCSPEAVALRKKWRRIEARG